MRLTDEVGALEDKIQPVLMVAGGELQSRHGVSALIP